MEEEMSAFCIQTTPAKRGSGTKCGRWNPTAEQVKVLTDLFRSGLRTPSTDQIQKISSQLSLYGNKVESKNVFYWFQNHKARERQKRRRISNDNTDTSCFHHRTPHHLAPFKCFGEINQVPYESHRPIETLQLFPLSSYHHELESEKMRVFSDEYKENNTAFAYALGREMDHPPLDLRLSFF